MSTNEAYDMTDGQSSSPQKKMENDRSPLIDRSNPLADGFFTGLLRPCLAEFVATAVFVFLGTMSVYNNPLIGVALAHGFAILLMITAIGSISGGHLNPVVTLGVWLCGGIPTLKAILYVLSQVLGGLLGASLTRGVLTETVFKAIRGGAQDLTDGVSTSQGLLCEVILTSILVLTVLLTAVDEECKSPMAPMAIGFAVLVDITAGGSITGASMNPARSFGPAVAVSTYDDSVWSYHWIYWLGPTLGSLLAVVLYKVFLASPSQRLCSFGSN